MASTTSRPKSKSPAHERGKLRIGDHWNAITIIALSQSNPLKAIAEMVENSIDAKATTITITRGRENNKHFLAIKDDGEGVPRDDEGKPDFRYVATHIGDSIKRRLKADGAKGLQGEFGIGLLSFWTIGDELTMTSTGADQRAYQMIMRKGDPGYEVTPKRTLFSDNGTEVKIAPLLEGIRAMSGEKIQWYLAAELRDRIRQSGVKIRVIDKFARTARGDIYAELYLCESSEVNHVALYRNGTRVFEDLALVDDFARAPWSLRYLQGLIDVPFINLTPGTRTGLIHDSAYATLLDGIKPLEQKLSDIIEQQRRAEEEKASRELLRTIQRAFREAIMTLPIEEYDWFDIQSRALRPTSGNANSAASSSDSEADGDALLGVTEPEPKEEKQRQFFEFAGPLFSVAVSPASSVVRVSESRKFQALPRDRSRRRVEHDLEFHWQIAEGGGRLEGEHSQVVTYAAPDEPGLSRLNVTIRQRDVECQAESLITVSHELLSQIGAANLPAQGLPGYTFERAAGESWRSRFDLARNLIVINNGHRDFVFSSRTKMLKLRYLIRLYAKELVLRNFVGLPADQLLERMVELSLRTEEHL